MPSGRYELVAGERRLRAATIAEIKEVSAVVKVLTDEEVTEIQLAENLQRENPHPLHEAQAIGTMQQAKKSMDEIAARLGKSKAFVYSRIRLLSLTEPFQEMFLNDIINIQEAFAIASLSAQSQQDFFEAYCSEWKKERHFRLHNLDYTLNRFRYDLIEAPFNTKDKKLLPDIGACTGCNFNTATLKSLFSEYAKQAICTNKECYHKKCAAHMLIQLGTALLEHKPDALLFNGEPSEYTLELIQSIPASAQLPRYSRYDISLYSPPEPPARQDYESDYDEDEPSFDEEGYNEAMEEYQTETDEYDLLLQSGKLLKGLLISESKMQCVYYNTEKQTSRNRQQTVTAKQVQEAIKAGTATAELLRAEIERMNSKEVRAKEIDREKVQLAVHEKFTGQLDADCENTQLTAADLAAARLLIYQSLDYASGKRVSAMLFPDGEGYDRDKNDNFYERICSLTNSQYSYLIRMAIACKSESKYPTNLTAAFFYKVAESAGLDIEAIEQQQQQKAEARDTKLEERIKELQKRITKLKPAE